jgi:hypothetical protein
MTVGSFSSGGLLTGYGWDTVLWVSSGPLVLAFTALAMRTKPIGYQAAV